MKPSTQRQLLNAVSSKETPKVWVVKSTYERGGDLKSSEPMTYRLAVVTAKMIRENMGYATIEKVNND